MMECSEIKKKKGEKTRKKNVLKKWKIQIKFIFIKKL